MAIGGQVCPRGADRAQVLVAGRRPLTREPDGAFGPLPRQVSAVPLLLRRPWPLEPQLCADAVAPAGRPQPRPTPPAPLRLRSALCSPVWRRLRPWQLGGAQVRPRGRRGQTWTPCRHGGAVRPTWPTLEQFKRYRLRSSMPTGSGSSSQSSNMQRSTTSDELRGGGRQAGTACAEGEDERWYRELIAP